MDIKKDGNIYSIIDSEKGINCTYDGESLKGKGSRKNKDEIIAQIESIKMTEILTEASDIYDSSNDDYKELASLSFIVNSLSDNVTSNEVSFKTLRKWQANPVKYAYEIYDYSKYLYGTTGIVTQTMNLFTGLHALSSSLKQTNPSRAVKEDLEAIKRYDSYINKESVIRDILKEVVHGTAIGYIHMKKWLQMLDISLYVPTRIVNGQWQVRIDLLRLTTADDNNSMYDYPNQYQQEKYNPREELISRQPQEIQKAFRNWQVGKSERYYDIPIEKTIVIKLNSTQQERYGRSLAMSAFDDLLHKQLIRKTEEVLLDKVVNQVMVLTMGESGLPTKDGSVQPTPEQRKAIGKSVKSILNKETTKDEAGTKIVGLPWWAKLESIAINLDLFKSTKYEEINLDILQSLGVADIFGADSGGSYASASVSIELFFRQIFIVLEQIEDQLFDKVYASIASNRDNIYTRRFSRGTVIGKDKLDILVKLLDIGGSIGLVLEEVGIGLDEYMDKVRDEKAMNLHELLEPFKTSYTMDNSDGGRPSNGSNNDNKNENPKPSTQ